MLNVGLGLAHLGAECSTITTLGGPARAAIEAEFAGLHVPLGAIDCQQPTRVCTTILDRATGVTTELVENARPLKSLELAAFVEVFRAAAASAQVVVLTGSLPAGVPESLYHDLLGDTAARAIIDGAGRTCCLLWRGGRWS